MPDRLRFLLGFASLLIVLGSGILMTLFTLQQSEAQVSREEYATLIETVNRLSEVVASVSPPPAQRVFRESPPAHSSSGRIAINTANQQELESLPGIGPARAKALLEARAERPFTDLDDIRARAPKVPASVLEDITPLITFE